MTNPLSAPGKLLGLAAVLAFSTAFATYTPPAGAQGNVGTNIPVLVMSEDEDPNTVKRSSDIFKRVIAELQGAMQRHGFRVIDEESVAADLGWEITDRRPKRQLIETIKLMSKSNQASHQVRAWVLFRVHAQAKELSFATKVQTRIDGEIYDAASNQFLDTFEMPREEYPAPKDCLESTICISEVVGDRAREIAGGLGEVLARKLARYSPPRASEGSGGSAVTGGTGGSGTSTHTGAGHGLMTPYTLTLRYFEDREALTIIGVMAEEFPGYEAHDFISKSPTVRRYTYLTTAKSVKLEEWLYILLRDMGFNARSDFVVLIQGTEITVDKLIPTPNRPESPDESRRFK